MSGEAQFTVEYYEGATLPDLAIPWKQPNGDPYPFKTGWTFSLLVTADPTQAGAFVKEHGFLGADDMNGDPAANLVVQWASSNEITTLEGGMTYQAYLSARRDEDGATTILHFAIRILPVGKPPT